MRKIFAMLLVFAMAFSFTACMSNSDGTDGEADRMFLLVKESVEQGNDTFSYTIEHTYSYDDAYVLTGKVTRITYNNNGEISTEDGTIEERYTYNEAGQMITITSVSGDDITETEMTYDAQGNMLRMVTQKDGEEQNRIVYAYDQDGNMILSEYYILGERSSYQEYTYDAEGQPLTTTYYDSDGTVRLQEYQYDGKGNQTGYTVKTNGILSERNEYVTEKGTKSNTLNTYDSLGKLMSTTVHVFDGDLLMSVTSTDSYGNSSEMLYEYDEAGNKIRFERRANGETSSVTTYTYIEVDPAAENQKVQSWQELEQEMKQAFLNQYDDKGKYTTDDIRVRRIGEFGGCQVAFVDGIFGYTTALSGETVAGYDFLYSSGQKLLVYKDGIYKHLKDAYDDGWLDDKVIRQLYEEYRESRASLYEY